MPRSTWAPPRPRGSRFHLNEACIQWLASACSLLAVFIECSSLLLLSVFPKAYLPAVQTVPFLAPASSWQFPTDGGGKGDPQHTRDDSPAKPCPPPLPSSLCLQAWKSLCPGQQDPGWLRALSLAERQPCCSPPWLRYFLQGPVVLTSRDGLFQRNRQAPWRVTAPAQGQGGNSVCPWSLSQT